MGKKDCTRGMYWLNALYLYTVSAAAVAVLMCFVLAIVDATNGPDVAIGRGWQIAWATSIIAALVPVVSVAGYYAMRWWIRAAKNIIKGECI